MTAEAAAARESLTGRIILAAGNRLVPRRVVGHLELVLPSRRILNLGNRSESPSAVLQLANWHPIGACMRRRSLGFAETYIAGDWDSPDLAGLFRFYLANRPGLDRAKKPVFFRSALDWLWHRRRANTPARARQNIAAHYDLGNAFYETWLDDTMSYSSAIFKTASDSLEAAQAAKIAALIDALELKPGHRLLEIGCGWGELACRAAEKVSQVRAITLSREQAAWCQTRSAEPNLAVAVEDYRATQGSFDRIASVEMIEAVGEENWPAYFRVLRDRLAPGGLAVVQAITIAEDAFATYRQAPDFIQRYIFPGGMLPTVAHLRAEAARQGLSFETVCNFGASYARTLTHWRERFEAAWPRIAAMGFDERFRRMWRYYLAYCEAAFAEAATDVGIYRFRRA